MFVSGFRKVSYTSWSWKWWPYEEAVLWCPVVQCPLFDRTRCIRVSPYVGCVSPTIVTESSLPSVQSATMAHFACCGPGSCALKRPVWGLCRLVVRQRSDQIPAFSWFGKIVIAPNCRTFSLNFPERPFLVSRSITQSRYLQMHWLVGYSALPRFDGWDCEYTVSILVCVVIFPFPKGWSHLWVALVPAGACWQDETWQEPFWRDSCWME